jgi:hypothetical protein
VLNKIACLQNRRDEEPNRELARELAETENREGIAEIAANLWNKDLDIQSDCVKVLYEVGYLKPELIADYVGDFLKLLRSRQNRLVWGGMLALSTIAHSQAGELYSHRQEILKAMREGSVITIDNAVKTLAVVATQKDDYNLEIFPELLKHLQTCRPKDVAQHCESILVAVNAENKAVFIQTLEKRVEDLSTSQTARVRKVIREAQNRLRMIADAEVNRC